MSARYWLPDELGGGEIEAEEVWGGCAGGQPEYRLVGSEIVVLAPRGTPFERVTPPLPPAPPVGSVVSIERGEPIGFPAVFQHQPRGSSSGWSRTGDDEDYAWAEVCAEGTPVLLVPAPEPVGLPWTAVCSVDGEDALSVGPPDSENQIIVKIRELRAGELRVVYLNAAQARAGSRALWTAADAAEAQS